MSTTTHDADEFLDFQTSSSTATELQKSFLACSKTTTTALINLMKWFLDVFHWVQILDMVSVYFRKRNACSLFRSWAFHFPKLHWVFFYSVRVCPKYTRIFIRGFLEGLWGSIYVEGLSLRGFRAWRGGTLCLCFIGSWERCLCIYCSMYPSIYEGRLFVCFVLFCFVCTDDEIQWTGMLQIVFLASLESSGGGGGGGVHWLWFHGVWTCSSSAKVLEYWMISSLKNIFKL